ncbi:MAG TPA: hypothetical protein VGK59_12775 [Ohtaekwangia sp.]
MKRITVLFPLLLAFACDDNDSDGCVKKILKENEMVRYTGQELGCSTHLKLYEFKNEQYFLFNNHCTDALYLPFDCDNTSICLEPESEACKNFEQAEYKGIVGITKS